MGVQLHSGILLWFRFSINTAHRFSSGLYTSPKGNLPPSVLSWCNIVFTLRSQHIFDPPVKPSRGAASGHSTRRPLSRHFHSDSQQVHLFPRGVQHVLLSKANSGAVKHQSFSSERFLGTNDSRWRWSGRTVCRHWTESRISFSTLCWASSRCASARCPDGNKNEVEKVSTVFVGV